MSLKLTFLVFKKSGKSCPYFGEGGGEVIWTKSKRTASFFRETFPKISFIKMSSISFSKRTASFFRETCPYPSHILFVFASIVWPFDYIFAQPGATWSHPGGHLQSLLVISSNFTFPSPLAFAKCVLGESLLRRFRSFYTREIQFHPTFVCLARVGWM